MRLRIVTPLEVTVDEADVASLRAEDASGDFGILSGHADFLTSLAVSVVRWTRQDGAVRFCAVRGGMLSVTAGREIAVATREAVVADDLAGLQLSILTRFHTEIEAERADRAGSTRLQIQAIRQIAGRLAPDRPVNFA
jgi:F-type H+-transporting ATPase subunit epsilon